MVEKETPTKVEVSGDHPPASEDALSLEALDSIIASEDPEFAQSLTEIGPDEISDLDLNNESLDLEYTLEAEKKKWAESEGWRKKFSHWFPFLPSISYKLKMRRTVLLLSWIKFKEQALYRIKNAGPLLAAWLKSQLGHLKTGIASFGASFKGFSLVKKIGFIVLLLTTGASAYFLYVLKTKTLLSENTDLFVNSMAEWAQSKELYDPKNQIEPFYDSTRTSQNILLMRKMIVNLRRSPESGPTPMAALELYVEGTAAEVVVEIKDREPEVEDLFLRTIEEMTFEQLSSGEGKKLLCDRLRKGVNKILTKGLVRRVFIKTAIVKP